MLWWHSGTQKRRGRTKQRDQIDNKARFFWKSTVKTKHESLTSLAFIRLVPGADRAVCHICIWCIYCLNYALLIAKYSIYNTCSCLHEKKLCFDSFLALLKEKISYEKLLLQTTKLHYLIKHMEILCDFYFYYFCCC